MNKKNRIKNNASNAFSRHTGIPTLQLSGEKDCLVVQQATVKLSKGGKPYQTTKLAAHIYTKADIKDIKKVSHKCGIDQCVHPDHLEITLVRSAQEGYNAAQEGWAV